VPAAKLLGPLEQRGAAADLMTSDASDHSRPPGALPLCDLGRGYEQRESASGCWGIGGHQVHVDPRRVAHVAR